MKQQEQQDFKDVEVRAAIARAKKFRLNERSSALFA